MITDSLLLMYVCGLLLGLSAGFVMHRSDYCIAGMFRDALMLKNTFMIRALGLQIVFTMIIFEVARLLGLLPLYPFPFLPLPSLANVMGGFVFGLGMVLAGGCVVGTLYKMGAGSIASGCAFLGLLAGSGLYAEFHPMWASVIKMTTLSQTVKTIPQLTGSNPTLFVVITVVITSFFFIKWYRKKEWERTAHVAGYLQPWKAAIILSIIGLVSYILVGMPLGITTTYAKIAAMLENLIIPDHVSKVAFFQGVPLNMVHPATGATMKGGAGPTLDTIWAIQFPVIVGITCGSFLSALLLREFSIHTRMPVYQYVMALTGGILLGLGSRMVPACNIWHLMGGLPVFAISSMLFIVGLIPGTWLGSKILFHLILQQSKKDIEALS